MVYQHLTNRIIFLNDWHLHNIDKDKYTELLKGQVVFPNTPNKPKKFSGFGYSLIH